MKYVWQVDVIEHDSWSGPKKLNTLFFWKKEDAVQYIAKKHGGRVGPTPEYYINYELVGQVAVPDVGEIK